MIDVIRYTTQGRQTKVDLKLADRTVRLSQLKIADLFQTSKQNISKHVLAIYEDQELDEKATVNQQLTVQKEGSREVSRALTFQSLMSAYVDLAEINAIEEREMRMGDYFRELDTILSSTDRKLLSSAGKISSPKAKEKAKIELQKYKALNLDKVEKDYLETISSLAKKSKEESGKKGGQA